MPAPVRTILYCEVENMALKDEPKPLSPTVTQVVDQFVTAMTGDDAINNDAINRLDRLLRQGAVPKPDEINTALFEPPADAAEDGDA